MTGETNETGWIGRALRRVRRVNRLVLRLAIVLVLIAAAGGAAYLMVDRTVAELTAPDPEAWYAPYVDVTLRPVYHFEDEAENPADNVVLSFVVAADDGTCTPTWGTFYTLDEAGSALDLDRRIARLRQRGGDVIVSFGGAVNDELATRCESVGELVSAYRGVIDRYDLRTIDLDIEGPGLDDHEANARRAESMAVVQQRAADEGEEVAVWVTLPVAPNGLPEAAVQLLDTMVGAGVDIEGVNAMTMNYGQSRTPDMSMIDATTSALESVWLQLRGVYARAGLDRTDDELWRMVGATPLIGQNDVATDRFSMDDAEELLDFAAERRMGRISIWSANRDGPCGAQLDTNVYQTTCSGLDQTPLQFNYLLEELPSRLEGAPATVAEVVTVDDPERSPYPVWRETKIYEAGDKVVRNGNVYEAKWWTQGDGPDEPVVNVWDTPWRYIGPVLESDLIDPVEVLPTDERPQWEPETVYVKGSEVVHEGGLFEAKWWNLNESPDSDPDTPWESPWEPIEPRSR